MAKLNSGYIGMLKLHAGWYSFISQDFDPEHRIRDCEFCEAPTQNMCLIKGRSGHRFHKVICRRCTGEIREREERAKELAKQRAEWEKGGWDDESIPF